MNDFVIGLGSALWLGILTSISPCPLATNIAAVSFVARRAHAPRQALWTGVLYTIGPGLLPATPPVSWDARMPRRAYPPVLERLP